jgi:hypothetical protein
MNKQLLNETLRLHNEFCVDEFRVNQAKFHHAKFTDALAWKESAE